MRHSMTLCALSLLLFSSCGGDDGGVFGEYEGVYKFTVHRIATDCELPEDQWQDGDEVGKHFRLASSDFFGQSILCWNDCNSATECEDECNLFRSFMLVGGKPGSVFNMTMGTGGSCTFTSGGATLEVTETGVKWTYVQESVAKTDLPEDECDTDNVDKYKSEMTCDRIEHFEAELQQDSD
jgi:hypothetical protein